MCFAVLDLTILINSRPFFLIFLFQQRRRDGAMQCGCVRYQHHQSYFQRGYDHDQRNMCWSHLARATLPRHPHFPLCRLYQPLCGLCSYLFQSPNVQSLRWDIGHRWWWCWLRLHTDTNICQYVPRPVWHFPTEPCVYTASYQHPVCCG